MTTDQRLDRLERQNHRLRLMVTALALGIAAFGAMAFAPQSSSSSPTPLQEVVARNLRIVDANGNTRITLGTLKDNAPFIALGDDHDHQLAQIIVRDGRGNLSFLDAEGKTRIGLGVTDNRTAVLTLSDSDGRSASIGVMQSIPGVRTTNADGTVIWTSLVK